MRKHTVPRWKFATAVLAVAFTFAACGGDDTSSDGTTLRDNGAQMRDGGQTIAGTPMPELDMLLMTLVVFIPSAFA